VAKRKTFLLRMSPDLWEEISRWAEDELRSVNGHVEYLLREAVRARRGGRAKPPDPRDRGAREDPDES
jgi:hypothetical protein